MSRTYRRKSCGYEYRWVLKDWDFPNGRIREIKYDQNSEKGKALVSVFHSDSTSTMEQVPKWYKVQFCRRPFRRKVREALIQAVKYLNEDIPFPVVKKDAMYYW